MCSALFVIKGEMYPRCKLIGINSCLANKLILKLSNLQKSEISRFIRKMYIYLSLLYRIFFDMI